jgi:hypothetical protein
MPERATAVDAPWLVVAPATLREHLNRLAALAEGETS